MFPMLRQYILLFILIVLCGEVCSAQDSTQWRGPQRNGIYSEKGLLKSWPEKGPELIWSFQGLGAGHGNVGIAKDRAFVLGMPEKTGILYAFSLSGELLWKNEYGPEWSENYTGPRSTPVVVGDRVYFESGTGTVFCYNAVNGEQIWSVDLMAKFGGTKVTWGMAESLLIDGDRLFCTPGGTQNNVVALNRLNGETIWTSPGNGQPSAYCSPILVRHNQTSLIVTMTAKSVIGVDAVTGQFYWQVPQFQRNKIHANTPVYYQGSIYCSSELDQTNSGLLALKLSDDGKSVTTQWRNETFRNVMGGIIVTDDHIYGSVYQKGLWCCLRASDGQIVYQYNGLGDGIIIMADGMFYCYSEKGEVALVSASPSAFNVVSRFQVPLGTDQHWSHPVIYRGKLYIRHGNAVMVYDIKGA